MSDIPTHRVRHRTRKVTIEAPQEIAALLPKVVSGAEVVLTIEGKPAMRLVPLGPHTLDLRSNSPAR